VVFVYAAILGPAPTLAQDHAHHDMTISTPGAPTGRSIYNLDATWTMQDGADIRLQALGGKPVIAAMGYTTCKDICPAIVADMMWIERHLPAEATNRVRFVFFSFDAEADTPERLKLYAEAHGLDLSHWTLLRADEDAVRELAAALAVSYRPNGRGGFDHAAVISILDAQGEIAFQQRGTASSQELLGTLQKILSAED
jgi:protein SCO1/2